MSRIYFEGVWKDEAAVNRKIEEYRAGISSLNRKEGEVLGLYLKRSVNLLCVMFALYELHIPFLPLDAEAPVKRNEKIAEDAGIKCVLANLPCELKNVKVYRVETLDMVKYDTVLNSDIAYCIATSGTTGNPKVVETGRGAFELWMKDFSHFLKLEQGGSMMCMSEYTFDMFMVESLFAKRKGMDIILVSDEEKKNPVKLSKLIRKEKPTYIQATPSRMKMLGMIDPDYQCLAGTKQVWLGGESIGKELLSKLQKAVERVVNIYGPTETTVCCMAGDVSDGDENIGTALSHSKVFLLNEQREEVIDGEEGEICIQGECLFRGYRNNEALTKEKYREWHGRKVYHTGDLAVKEGEVYRYCGRLDTQVKIRGYRVELAEIESSLLEIAGIRDICAAVTQSQEIHVFYVADREILAAEFLERAKSVLPEYMIPYKYTRVEMIPVTTNGKRDRDALLQTKTVYRKESLKDIDRNSEGDVADIILKMVQERLETEKGVDLDTKLEEVGVDSLMYVELLVEIEEQFGMEFEDDKVSYKELATVRDIVEYVEERIL